MDGGWEIKSGQFNIHNKPSALGVGVTKCGKKFVHFMHLNSKSVYIAIIHCFTASHYYELRSSLYSPCFFNFIGCSRVKSANSLIKYVSSEKLLCAPFTWSYEQIFV